MKVLPSITPLGMFPQYADYDSGELWTLALERWWEQEKVYSQTLGNFIGTYNANLNELNTSFKTVEDNKNLTQTLATQSQEAKRVALNCTYEASEAKGIAINNANTAIIKANEAKKSANEALRYKNQAKQISGGNIIAEQVLFPNGDNLEDVIFDTQILTLTGAI